MEMPDMSEKEGHEGKSEKSGKEEGGKMDQLASMMVGKEMSEGKGWGAALGGGLVGLLLGSNGNGNGILGGGLSNADRFAATDTLVQATSNATQNKISESTFALSSQLCNVANNLSTQMAQGFCNLETGQQKILCAVEGVGARVALAEERIIGSQNSLAAAAENRALLARIAELERLVPAPTTNVSIDGTIDVITNAVVSRLAPMLAAK